MALQMPRTFLTTIRDVRRARSLTSRDGEHRSFRLALHHQADLRDVALGIEETNAGVACKYLVEHVLGEGRDEDVALHELERWCDKFEVWSHPSVKNWRRRITRCRRALGLLAQDGDTKSVSVLHVTYGHPDPSIARGWSKKTQDYLGELAPLAKYTDVVETRRVELARQEALHACARPSRESTQVDEAHARQESINLGASPEAGAFLYDLIKHREKYEWALRVTSSGQALDRALGSFQEQAPTKKLQDSPSFHASQMDAWSARRDASAQKQESFLVQVKLEASKMLEGASLAYHGAWLMAGSASGELDGSFTCKRVRGQEAEPRERGMLNQVRDGKRGSGWSFT